MALVARTLLLLGAASIILSVLGCDGDPNSSALAHLERAKEYRANNRIAETIIELKNALQKNPKSVEARWLLGKTYLDIGNGAAARKEIRLAQELGIDTPEATRALARAALLENDFQSVLDETPQIDDANASASLLSLRAEALLRLNRIDESRSTFTAAASLDPGAIGAPLGLARLALLERNFEKAFQHLDTAENINGENVYLWLLRGDTEMAQNRPADAAQAYRRVDDIVQQNPYAQVGIARAMLAQNKPDDALLALQQLLKRSPNHPTGKYLTALAASQKGNHQQSIDTLRQVLADNPNHPESLLLLGNLQLSEGHLEQAEEYVTRFTAIIPNYRPAVHLLAGVQLLRAKATQAIETLAKLPLNDMQHYALLGTAYMQQRDFSRATEFLEKAAALAPNPAQLKTQLALGHLAAGANQKAVSELQTALELDPDLLQADALLGLCPFAQARIQAGDRRRTSADAEKT